MRRVVTVLGSPRGGTSVAARSLISLGVEFGADFVYTDEHNPTGYWEDRTIVDLNDRLLRAAGSRVDGAAGPDLGSVAPGLRSELGNQAVRYVRKRLRRQRPWGFKDPRATRLLPFWQDVFAGVGAEDSYLIVLRHPMSVALSSGARRGVPETILHELRWLDYMLAALVHTEHRPRVVVDYDRLVDSPATELARIAATLDLGGGRVAEAADELATGFLDPALRHSRGAAEERPSHSLTRALYGLLEGLAIGAVDAASPSASRAVAEMAAAFHAPDGYFREYALWADRVIDWAAFWEETARGREQIMIALEHKLAERDQDRASPPWRRAWRRVSRAATRAGSSRGSIVVAAGAVVFALHLVALALLPPRPAADLPGLLAAATLSLAGAAGAALTRRRSARAVLAAVAGGSAALPGAGIYLPHVLLAAAGACDYTGVVAGAAGVLLVAVALRTALRNAGWRLQLAGAAVAAFVGLEFLLYPAAVAGIRVASAPTTLPAASALGLAGAREVTVAARDGVSLGGWYVQGTNGGAVIVLHRAADGRVESVQHVELLAAAGYAVLALDARGSGRSGGLPNSWGSRASDTLAGAVTFMSAQPGIDPARIAVLGISTGAVEALRAAADGVPLAAVIADAPVPATQGDAAAALPSVEPRWLVPLDLSRTWVQMRVTSLATGDPEPTPLIDVASRIHVPVLLISTSPAPHADAAGAAVERALADAYGRRIGGNATVWHAGGGSQRRAIARSTSAYALRVSTFLATAMRSRAAPR